MKFKPQDTLAWLQHFVDSCEQNNLWYAADSSTLLGTYRHGGFVPWNKKAEVMMTRESYAELRRLFPHNVIDSSIDSSYKSLLPSFVSEVSTWEDEAPFVQIRIVVPTTIAKVKAFNNTSKNLISRAMHKKSNIKNAINSLFDNKYEGHYWITSNDSKLKDSWHPTFSFDLTKKTFNTIQINVPVQAEELLVKWFGADYMTCKSPEVFYEFPSPNTIVTVNLKKEKPY